MSRQIASSRFRLPGLPRRRPTLEVHVPMSPTPSFLYQLRCLTHSLRRFGGAYRDSPVIATVGGNPVDERLADRMPWLAANGIELRWVPADDFAAWGAPITVDFRLKHAYRSDVVLLLDADTLIRRPLDDLIERVHRDRVLAGTIAHASPLPHGKLARPDWAHLFALCGLPERRLEYEHTGWGYMSDNPDHRYCPAYFNYGVIAAPSAMVSRIGEVSKTFLIRLTETMASHFDAQIAFAMAIARVGAPVLPLPLRYNMPNNPYLEALHHTEVEHATVLHLLAELHFRRTETFASLASLKAFAARPDLRVVSGMAQEIIRAILPDLIAEESSDVIAA
jgi:hypothetical protein